MRTMKPVALAGLFFLMAVSVAADQPPVSISKMTPGQVRVATAGRIGRLANVILVVRVEVSKTNRQLDISCDGLDGGVYVASRETFENGEKQAKIYAFGFFLPPATYRCEAVLERKLEDGKMKTFRSYTEVMVN